MTVPSHGQPYKVMSYTTNMAVPSHGQPYKAMLFTNMSHE